VIQFDEPAFNVYMSEVAAWGIDALHRRSRPDLPHRGAHLLRLRHPGQPGVERDVGQEWRQYEKIFPALAQSRIDQVSVECANAKVPVALLGCSRARTCWSAASTWRATRWKRPRTSRA